MVLGAGSQSGQSEQQSISLSLLNSLICTASLTVVYFTFKLVDGRSALVATSVF